VNIVNGYAYTPFGQIANEQETVENPFNFGGQFGVMTKPNGLYYMKSRYYDSEVGRFISEDPLGFEGGSLNLYVYAANNPIMFMDPLGLCAESSNYTFWDGVIDVGSGILTGIDLILGGPTGEGIVPAVILQGIKTGKNTAKIAGDIAKAVKRFQKLKLNKQVKEYKNLQKTNFEHLKKYGQQPGKTTGEVNRIERQLEQYEKILESRGQ
jgi:RHS repeat-associated protein